MQFELFKDLLRKVQSESEFYKEKFEKEAFDVETIRKAEDICKIPFTTKEDLRDAYPLRLQAVPDEKIVRIHSSSGTTGKPVIIPYTEGDVEGWSTMMKRCMEVAGVNKTDRVQITPGYGLWTAGIGFQAGVEKLGAMAVPTGPGNTEKQLQMMQDLKSTTLVATSSYALLLAEEVEKRNLKDTIHLKRAILGSERWGEKMRKRIKEKLGVELYDIYGLTEIYGPGISISCECGTGLHYWDDYLYFEIIDPITGENVPDGEYGELVITTLKKEGAPLIRYRTRDITRLLPGKCTCGLDYPRHDIIMGRTDDMIKIKGVNIYPGQIEDVLKNVAGASSEYQIQLDHKDSKDSMTLSVEVEEEYDKSKVEEHIKHYFKTKIGILINVQGKNLKELPRSEKKTKRVIDNRYD